MRARRARRGVRRGRVSSVVRALAGTTFVAFLWAVEVGGTGAN